MMCQISHVQQWASFRQQAELVGCWQPRNQHTAASGNYHDVTSAAGFPRAAYPRRLPARRPRARSQAPRAGACCALSQGRRLVRHRMRAARVPIVKSGPSVYQARLFARRHCLPMSTHDSSFTPASAFCGRLHLTHHQVKGQ